MNFDITIAGELNLDLILYGLPHDLPYERETIANDMCLTLGSSSAILAHNLAALGSSVGFISRVGPDSLGEIALGRLTEVGVDISRVVRKKRGCATGLSVILNQERNRRILTYPGTMFEMGYADLDIEYLASARHFHMSSLFLHRALQNDIARVFRALRDRGLSTSLDTNDDPEDRWEGVLHEVLPFVDVLLVNAREAHKITQTTLLESAIDWLSKHVQTVVIKMGPEGALAVRSGKRITIPAIPVEVIDPVGAGDSFNAGFLHQFVRNADLETCLRYGNAAGAFSATRHGGTEAFRDREEMHAFFLDTGIALT